MTEGGDLKMRSGEKNILERMTGFIEVKLYALALEVYDGSCDQNEKKQRILFSRKCHRV